MEAPKVKLAYIASKFRVTAQVNKEECLALKTAPEDLLTRARAKMQAIQKAGDIDLFSVYDSKLLHFWSSMCQDQSLDPKTPVTIVLAEGSPNLDAIEVKRPEKEGNVCDISINASLAEIRSWRLEWLVFFINHSLALLDESRPANPAQIHGAWLRAAFGQSVSNLGIAAQLDQRKESSAEQKPYAFSANKQRQEITLAIYDLQATKKALDMAKLLELGNAAAQKIKESFGGHYHPLKRDLQSRLQQALHGPELIGIDLPFVALAASSAGMAPVNATGPVESQLNISFSADGMEAKITGFSSSMYENPEVKMNEDWLSGEIRRHGIEPKMARPYLNDLTQAILAKSDLNNLTVACGVKSRGGSEPFLKSVFKKTGAATPDLSDAKDNKLELRELNQRQIVKKGDLIAQTEFEKPPEIGSDIFGQPLPPAKTPPFRGEVGEGAKEEGKGRFYATIDGIPHVSKQSVGVKNKMVHKGDVNLRTGNITFDGPVEILGSVDSGAQVSVTGDLIVMGSIRNALVNCRGSLTVGSGITTGERGFVVIGENLNCEFIENAKIQCGGSIFVAKGLLNSDVICGGKIELRNKKDGLIAGGTVSSRRNIVTANLGYRDGHVTTVNVGVDWKAELRVRNLRKRIENLKAAQQEYRLALRELIGRTSSQQKTKKTQERKDHFQSRLVRVRAIIETLEEHLVKAVRNLVFEDNVMIFVHGTLYKNVHLTLGGSHVPVTQDIAGVVASSKKKGHSNIIPIEVIEEQQRKAKEESALRKKEQKKAAAKTDEDSEDKAAS